MLRRLWHSRRLAAPEEYSELTPEERGKKPPAYHRLVQRTPNGEEETFFLAAHAKRLFSKDGEELEDSQKKIWDLIAHCTQDKVSPIPIYIYIFILIFMGLDPLMAPWETGSS